MSVSAILGADGKIAAAFLPSGTANAYVDNPMTENLDGGGFDMLNLDDITCSNIISKSHDVANGAGTVIGSFTTGAPILGSTPVVLDTGLTVQGDANIGLIVDGAYGINAITASLETLDITAPTGVGINFTNGANIIGVGDIIGTGGLTMGSAELNFLSTGQLGITVSPNNFIGFKQLVAGAGTVASPSISANDIIFITPQCQNVAGTAVYYTAAVSGGVGFTITSRTLSTGAANGTDTSTVGFVVIRAGV